MQEADERAEIQGKTLHLTANLFAVVFGVAGLAQAWPAVTQLANDPTFGPFTALIAVVPMLLGVRLAEQPEALPDGNVRTPPQSGHGAL
jgi:hypothetical protein